MKTTRLLSIALLVTILLTGSLRAQEQTPPPANGSSVQMLTPEQKLDKRLAHLQKKLKLTDAQVSQLRTIIQQHMATLQADRQNLRQAAPGTDARKDARKQLATDAKSLTSDLKPVLTPEQIKEFKKMRIEQINRQEERLEKRKNAIK
jgi:Spy/CpxP family protein refolding chaperone